MSSFLKGLFGTPHKDEQHPEPSDVHTGARVDPTPTFHTLGILDARGVTPEERDRVAKAQQLLRSLPQETPDPVKREIVEAALKAFAVSIEDIVSAARHEMDVLANVIREGETTMEQLEAQANERIAELERHIKAVREELARIESEQDVVERQVRTVMDDVEPVLRFFGGAPVPPPPPKRLPSPPPRRPVDDRDASADEPHDENTSELRAS